MLLNLIRHQQPDIDNIYLSVKDTFEWKHQLLINKREKIGIEILKNPKPFTNNSQTIDDVCKNLEDYDPSDKGRVLIVFDDMIADIQ